MALSMMRCSSWRVALTRQCNIVGTSSSSSSKGSSVCNASVIKRYIVNDLTDLGYTPDKLPGPLRIETFNQKQITNLRVQEAIKKMRIHDADTGSAPAQIAAMTERIQNITRHFAMHKKDNHSLRGFQMLVSRRRKMLAYLKRSDFDLFKETVKTIGLQKEASNLSK